MEINDKIERNGEIGTIMNIINDTAYVWWHTLGKYKWEPCNIKTLKQQVRSDEQRRSK
jgi:hypothetical protein